ncbi:MAG: type II toxin-antitoxin system HipA family toxin [Burkholderiaceae bacterium]
MRALRVYFDDRYAGSLTQDDAGSLSFAYAATYLADRQSRAISFAMPLREYGYEDRIARPYFSGLLPDEGARRRLAAALGVSAENPFGLLEIIGGDCAGALSLYPSGVEPAFPAVERARWLRGEELAELVERLELRPLLAGEHGLRLSLAGAQNKLAVCARKDAIGIAQDGAPTTHILKPPITALDGTVENELFCLRLASRLRLPVAHAELRHAGSMPLLLVERYDRATLNGRVHRLHQEDFCQALSVSPELKYEVEGGPGVSQSLALIDRACARPAADRLGFVRGLIYQYLIGNADGHAKNYALLYRGVAPDLAPFYDLLCTAVYPRLSKALAMRIGGRNMPDTIRLDDWATVLAPGRTASRILERELLGLATRIGPEADRLLEEFAAAGIVHPLLVRIRRLIETRRTHVLRMIEKARPRE